MEQLGAACSQVTDPRWNISIEIVFPFLLGVGCSETHANVLRLKVVIEIRVNNSCFECLECPIKQLKSVPANQFIVPIQHYNDWVLTALLQSSLVNILQGCNPFGVFDVNILRLVNLVETKIVSIYLPTSVGGRIVDDYLFEISIVLEEYWVEIGLNSKACVIVVAWRYNTHRQLVFHTTDFKLLL